MARRGRAAGRRLARAAPGRGRAGGRRGPLYGRRPARRDAARTGPARAGRALPRHRARPRRRTGDARRPGGDRPRRAADHERRQPADRRAGVGRRTGRGDRGGHARGGDGGPRGARVHLRGAGAARPRGRTERAAVHRGPARDRSRRPRRRARRRRRADRVHLRDPGARAVAARAARRRRPLGGRLAHRLGLDAGDLRRPPGARTALRPRAGAGARDLRVHRRRLRREAGRRDRGAPRRRARPLHRSARCASRWAATRSRSWAADARGHGRP